jgi:hypothetical protein
MDMITIKISDNTLSGKELNSLQLQLASTLTTAKKIISERIQHEVARYNQAEQQLRFNGLVQPTQAEMTLNNYENKPKRTIDAVVQCRKAYDAFEHNGFFLLVDDKQIIELDEAFTISEVSTVQFVKLVPLVGG